MAPYSSTFAWKIPWMEEPGRLQSMGSLESDTTERLSDFTFMHWKRKWQPTPVFLPGESHGRGSLVGCRLWGRTESDTTEATQQQQQQYIERPSAQTSIISPDSQHHRFTLCCNKSPSFGSPLKIGRCQKEGTNILVENTVQITFCLDKLGLPDGAEHLEEEGEEVVETGC